MVIRALFSPSASADIPVGLLLDAKAITGVCYGGAVLHLTVQRAFVNPACISRGSDAWKAASTSKGALVAEHVWFAAFAFA